MDTQGTVGGAQRPYGQCKKPGSKRLELCDSWNLYILEMAKLQGLKQTVFQGLQVGKGVTQGG